MNAQPNQMAIYIFLSLLIDPSVHKALVCELIQMTTMIFFPHYSAHISKL